MKKKTLFGLIAIALIVVIILIILYNYAGKSLVFDPKDDAPRHIEIEMGATTEAIANKLQKEGIIEKPSRFSLFSKFNKYDGQYKAGEYYLSPSMSYKDIAEILKKGYVDARKITIPEGYTAKDIADELAAESLVDRDVFLDLCKSGDFDYDLIKEKSDAPVRLEGFLFPDTYQISKDETEEAIIDKMLDRFNDVYTEEYRKRASELGLSTNELITIASIIEKETKLDEERKIVSGVIYNRLDLGMPLGMDSTLHYILDKKDPLTVDELDMDSPYNTYKFPGLPPGPIAMPGQKSIEAALYPEDTDYLYFVLSPKGDGSNAFSTDYEDFLADKKAYYDSIS